MVVSRCPRAPHGSLGIHELYTLILGQPPRDRAGDGFSATGPHLVAQGEHPRWGPGADVPDSTAGRVDRKPLPRPHPGADSRNHAPPAPDVALWPRATHVASARSMTWALCPLDVGLLSGCSTRLPRVRQRAVRLVVDDGVPSRPTRWPLRRSRFSRPGMVGYMPGDRLWACA